MSGDAVLARARAVLGCPFRPQGRAPDTGFDCVGLAGWAYGIEAARDYRLRSNDLARLERGLAAAGLARGDARAAGDLLVLRGGAGQIHLGIDSGEGLVHADAALRRVVERPDPLPWPLIARWRIQGD